MPGKATKPEVTLLVLKKAWKGFLAAVTSPDVVKAEKSVVVLVLTRVLIAAGAGSGVVELLKVLFK